MTTLSSKDGVEGRGSDTSFQCGIRRGNVRIVNGKAEKIPRPMNAFMLFSNEFRKQVKDEFPDEPNNVISTRLGAMWKSMNGEERMKYHNLAKEAEKEHKRKYPNYQYCPGEARKFKKARLEEKARQEALYRSILQNSGFGSMKPQGRPLQFPLSMKSMQNPPTMQSNINMTKVPTSASISQPLTIVPPNIHLLKPTILAMPTPTPAPARRVSPDNGGTRQRRAFQSTLAEKLDSEKKLCEMNAGVKEEEVAWCDNPCQSGPRQAFSNSPALFRIDPNLLPRPAHQPVNRTYPGVFQNGNTRDEFIPQLVYVPCDVKYAEKFGWTKDMFYSPSNQQNNPKQQSDNVASKSSSHTSADSSDSSVDYGNYFSPMDGGCWGEEDSMTQPKAVNAVRRRSFVGSPPKENGQTPTYAILSESVSGASLSTKESTSSTSLGEVSPHKLQAMVDVKSFTPTSASNVLRATVV